MENPVSREYVRVELTNSQIEDKLNNEQQVYDDLETSETTYLNNSNSKDAIVNHGFAIPYPQSLRSKHDMDGNPRNGLTNTSTPYDEDTTLIDSTKLVYCFFQVRIIFECHSLPNNVSNDFDRCRTDGDAP